MIISMIAAMDLERGIGYQGKVPWHLPSDLRRFKGLTMGHHIIMGRKTYEAIGRELPGRISVVLTRHAERLPEGCLGAASIQDALALAKKAHETEAFIIGGGEIFSQTLGVADRIYLTTVQARFLCDVRFPVLEEDEWKVIHQKKIPKSDIDSYDTLYCKLERVHTLPAYAGFSRRRSTL